MTRLVRRRELMSRFLGSRISAMWCSISFGQSMRDDRGRFRIPHGNRMRCMIRFMILGDIDD